MGMRKRKCPMCGKKKSFHEGSVVREFAPKWFVSDHVVICRTCGEKTPGAVPYLGRKQKSAGVNDPALKDGVSAQEIR